MEKAEQNTFKKSKANEIFEESKLMKDPIFDNNKRNIDNVEIEEESIFGGTIELKRITSADIRNKTAKITDAKLRQLEEDVFSVIKKPSE